MEICEQVLEGYTPVVYAKGQPEYRPLPVIRREWPKECPVTSRWTFTPEERKAIAEGADLYLTMLTFHQPLQPVLLQVFGDPKDAEKVLFEQGYLPPFPDKEKNG